MMKIRSFLAASALCVGLSARADNPPPLPVAIFNIEAADAELVKEATNLSSLLSTYLATDDSIILVERQQLDAVLGEQSLGASGLVNPADAAKVGQLTGAKVLVLSRVFAQGQSLMLITKLVSTETGRVLAEAGALPPGEARTETLRAFAVHLAARLRASRKDLLVPPESPEEQVSRLEKLVAGHRLPSVSVTIPEHHITHRLADPAAETEIANILGRLGFSLVSTSAATPAEYQITGEAISEQAIRRGDFVSCRARVEIKMVEAATGRILLQDRRTEVAADTAEAIAAKTALQKAGSVLAEHVVGRFLANK